jgi:very-short-patch-repair endonuclease
MRKKKTKKQIAKEQARFKRNRKKARKYSRMLKSKITKAERMVKEVLDEGGIIYEFQKPFYDHQHCYIVDFFLTAISGKKYVIEIDGKTHNKRSRPYDVRRSMFLYARMGCCVIRIKNEEVFEDLDKVMNRIYDFNPMCIDDKFKNNDTI